MLRVDVGTQVDTTASVQGLSESEYEDSSSLRKQLAAAHQALRLQTARYRQATRRLEQQDLEINNMTSLRDQHLNRVLRALVVLEAGLRREQRSIRSQLGERDILIRTQQHEISQLKQALLGEVRQEEVQPCQQPSEPKQFDYDCAVKPDLISSLGISHFQRCQVTPTTTDNEDCQSNLDSLQLSFYEISSQPESLLSNVSSQSCSRETPDPLREQQASIETHNSCNLDESHSLNDVNVKNTDGKNICKCQQDNYKNSKFDDNADLLQSGQKASNGVGVLNRSYPARSVHFEDGSSPNLKDCKPSPSTLLQEVRISGKNEYEDNPVLNCVNQILLRDQEEFLEEQRVLRLKEEEKSKKETEAKINNQKLSRSTDNLELLNEKMSVHHFPVKKITTPPFENVLSRQQKIHQTTRKKHTSPNKFKEEHLKSIPQLQHSLDLSLLKENVNNKSTPPALPPKPQRLITNHKEFDQKTMKSIIPQLECGDSLNMIRKRVSLHNPSDELYVISNSAIDDEILLQLQGKEIDSYSEPHKSKPFIDQTKLTKGNIYSPVLIHPTHKSPVKPPHFPSNITQTPKDDNLCKNVQQNSPKKTISSSTAYIKVASPVACLINSVEALETSADGNSEKQPSPSVSQIVRKFEDLGSKSITISEASETYDSNNLQKNFEEFHLDECDMDDVNGVGRPEGDGAETGLHVSAMALEAKISYENFLDATGLSQKSIATPSRLFSNHKRVMKPKDVKHRSRVKAVDRCSNTSASAGSVVRYWTEPFL